MKITFFEFLRLNCLLLVLVVAQLISPGGIEPNCSAQTKLTSFAEPEILKVKEAPLNKDGKMRFLSPAIFDIDQDGQAELVIGTIGGDLFACENSNRSKGEPQWQSPKPVKTHDGKPIKLHNW